MSMSKSFKSTFGITLRFGAEHNSISRNGMTRDLSSVDVEQRKANEKAARIGIVNLGGWAKPGHEKNRKRRQRKGYSHAAKTVAA
jgi:hypothetical protein